MMIRSYVDIFIQNHLYKYLLFKIIIKCEKHEFDGKEFTFEDYQKTIENNIKNQIKRIKKI